MTLDIGQFSKTSRLRLLQEAASAILTLYFFCPPASQRMYSFDIISVAYLLSQASDSTLLRKINSDCSAFYCDYRFFILSRMLMAQTEICLLSYFKDSV